MANEAEAHPELIEQIDAVTSEISVSPRNGILFLRRGELHRLHRDWEKASVDYDAASQNGADLAGVQLSRARLSFDQGNTTAARNLLDALTAEFPELPAVHLKRAEVLEKVGDHLGAADAYTSAILTTPDPRPDMYIQRANQLATVTRLEAAVASIEDGIARLGPLVTLDLKAMEFEEAAGNTTAAISRLQGISDRAPRKESYLVRLAELSARTGDRSSAQQFAKAAEDAISKLPPRLQSTSATLALVDRLLRLKSATLHH